MADGRSATGRATSTELDDHTARRLDGRSCRPDALEIPLRERNALLVAGGYALRYFETGLAAPELARMRSAIELILEHQDPYPAFVLDRHWEIRLANRAAARCTRFLLGADPAHSTSKSKGLLAEVLAYPGVPSEWRTRELGVPTTPLLTTIFRKGDVELHFFSTFTTFATPQDVTLEELRIECSFQANDATATACRELFGA